MVSGLAVVIVVCKKALFPATNTCRTEDGAMLDETPEALFKSWLREYGGTVLKVARAYTLTAEECQDLAQEILLQLWRSLPQFQGRASASTRVIRVALNTALGWHRKKGRRRELQALLAGLKDTTQAG